MSQSNANHTKRCACPDCAILRADRVELLELQVERLNGELDAYRIGFPKVQKDRDDALLQISEQERLLVEGRHLVVRIEWIVSAYFRARKPHADGCLCSFCQIRGALTLKRVAPVTNSATSINQQCWCAAKAEAKDAVCPLHG